MDKDKGNPWLYIPLSDYEAHMASPAVAQAQLLSDLFAEAVERLAPGSAALLGCSGGNGLERIGPRTMERIVCIDINSGYLERLRERFEGSLAGLELYAGDIEEDELDMEPVELAFAGLLFEYVDVEKALRRIRRMLVHGGTLVSVLQLPSAACGPVTPSAYRSLGSLEGFMRLVPPGRFRLAAEDSGFASAGERDVQAGGGKRFRVMDLTA